MADEGALTLGWKALADPGPMARFEALRADVEFPGVVFDWLCEGKELRAIASPKAPGLGLPKGLFIKWFMTEHADLYAAARKVRATDMALDALNAALKATSKNVAVKALQAKVALHLAARWDREGYGEHVRVERAVTVGVDAGLLGFASELLTRIAPYNASVPCRVIDGDLTLAQAEPT
jgi:hypothetical protein